MWSLNVRFRGNVALLVFALLGCVVLLSNCRPLPDEQEILQRQPLAAADSSAEAQPKESFDNQPGSGSENELPGSMWAALPSIPGVSPDVVAEILAHRDFSRLRSLEGEFEAKGPLEDVVAHAFERLWALLASRMKPRRIVDGLNVLGVETSVTGENQYTFSFLFRPTKDIDADYHLAFDGFVLPCNATLLEPEDCERGFAKFYRRLSDNPTSEWREGEYHIVSAKAETALIPYNLILRIYEPTHDVFWHLVGKEVALGWQWAVKDEAEFLTRIVRCETPAELYAIAPPGPRLGPTVANAIDSKWSHLTDGLTPQPLIDGLDLLGLETKATGPSEYTFSFLFHCTSDLEIDYDLGIIARVDSSHLSQIDPVEPGADYTKWHLDLSRNPTSLWQAGEYHVGQLIVKTAIIPYEITVFLRAPGQEDYNPGNVIRLGWRADVREGEK